MAIDKDYCEGSILGSLSGGVGDYSYTIGNYPNETRIPVCDWYTEHKKLEQQLIKEEREKELSRMREKIIRMTSQSFYGEPIINSKKEKQKMSLSIIAKKLFDADTRVLVKADILDTDLTLTEEGVDFVLEFIVTHFKQEMAIEAKKLLKEQKDEE